jgi:hypothetical protein
VDVRKGGGQDVVLDILHCGLRSTTMWPCRAATATRALSTPYANTILLHNEC